MLYLTGDRAMERPDGTIEFLGRIDRQVKIAGHRVELAAVENALSASPLVADAAVVVVTVPSGEKQLVACVALANPDTKCRSDIARVAASAAVSHLDTAALDFSGEDFRSTRMASWIAAHLQTLVKLDC